MAWYLWNAVKVWHLGLDGFLSTQGLARIVIALAVVVVVSVVNVFHSITFVRLILKRSVRRRRSFSATIVARRRGARRNVALRLGSMVPGYRAGLLPLLILILIILRHRLRALKLWGLLRGAEGHAKAADIVVRPRRV